MTTEQTHNWTEKSLQLSSGINIAYKVWGNENATKKIIAVHGWVDNSGTWDTLAPFIIEGTKDPKTQESRVEFVAIDLPGHGQSDHYPFKLMRYRFVDWVSILFEFIELKGWKKYTLLGHSMGAGITSICAGIRPHEVEGLINIEGFGPWTEEDEDEKVVKKFRESLANFNGAANRPAKEYPSIDHAVDKLLQNNPTLKRSSAECLVKRAVKEVVTAVSLESENGENNEKEKIHFEFRHDPRLLVPDQTRSITHNQVPYFLKEITCKTLVIHGDKGIGKVKKYIEQRKEFVQNLSHVEVEGAHHVHLDNPDAVAPHLNQFLLDTLFE